jgi:hypothetical protein
MRQVINMRKLEKFIGLQPGALVQHGLYPPNFQVLRSYPLVVAGRTDKIIYTYIRGPTGGSAPLLCQVVVVAVT